MSDSQNRISSAKNSAISIFQIPESKPDRVSTRVETTRHTHESNRVDGQTIGLDVGDRSEGNPKDRLNRRSQRPQREEGQLDPLRSLRPPVPCFCIAACWRPICCVVCLAPPMGLWRWNRAVRDPEPALHFDPGYRITSRWGWTKSLRGRDGIQSHNRAAFLRNQRRVAPGAFPSHTLSGHQRSAILATEAATAFGPQSASSATQESCFNRFSCLNLRSQANRCDEAPDHRNSDSREWPDAHH